MDGQSGVNPEAASVAVADASSIDIMLRKFFPFYCLLAAVATFGYARFDAYQVDGDAVNYMDLADLLRTHQWAGIVNGYWHPMYPALLALGRVVTHASVVNELRAYYLVNFGIFLLEMVAMVCFVDAIGRMRAVLQREQTVADFLLGKYPLRYLGLGLLVVASQRELSLGKVRPDALLQAMLLFALAALLTHLATGRVRYAGLMGVALGCAYLTKSFAFVLTFLCVLALCGFRWLWLKHSPVRIISAALVALVCFGVIAGPYVAALTRQRGRLDFGDSGSLNYAWFVAGTEKMHLQPYMTGDFGSADVRLKHPNFELLRAPQVLSYAALPYGTYPDWFDPSYWNDQVKPHFKLRDDLPRVVRNGELVVRYLLNHPEALVLLLLLVVLGARPGFKPNAFWVVPLALGVMIWGIYAVVNTEERYVTVAYLCLILTLFATLRAATALRPIAAVLVLLLAVGAVGESLRTVLEDRRELSGSGVPGGWYSLKEEHAAAALRSMGLQPGDAVACVGAACLGDYYWARLAQVRILTEIFDPYTTPTYEFMEELPNRDQAIGVVRAQGAKVLVADFEGAPANDATLAEQGWQQLGDTTLYELPLNVPPGTVPVKLPAPPAVKPSV